MEVHPRSPKIKFPTINERIILGSFPTWALALSHDNSDNSSRQIVKEANKDFDFFYGSCGNYFWDWYQRFIDVNIVPNDPFSIETSLKSCGIGITDIILSCHRKGRSSLDKHLTKRVYNLNFLTPGANTRTKILCTSKAVLNSMLLSKMFFLEYPHLTIDFEKSQSLTRTIVAAFGDSQYLKHPIARVLKNKNGETIECVAIPSPGSPFRKLQDFGMPRDNDAKLFLHLYLQSVFRWFKA